MVVKTPHELSEEQRAAVDVLLRWPKQIQTCGGLAGTGKTYLISALAASLPSFAVCAYTGKAVDVLRRRGIEANTIHSLAYRRHVVEDPSTRKKIERYSRRDELSFWDSEDIIEGLIVDEASMIGRSLYDDLVGFDVPMIFVGDHGQLEPIGDRDFNLMGSPDVTLETIHRNAGDIARFAGHLRLGGEPRSFKSKDGSVRFSRTPSEEYARVDQMICAFNAKRIQLNNAIRGKLGRSGDQPEKGDRVICLKNSRDYEVFNGMQGTVVEIGQEQQNGQWTDMMSFLGDDGIERRVPYVPQQFNAEKKIDWEEFRGRIPFDFSYAVTCHKMQGSEADRIMVFDQACRAWDTRRWRYTAASRARMELIWV